MTRDMKKKFNFVNVQGNAFYDITATVLELEYGAAAA